MALFVTGLIVFFGTHIFTTFFRGARAAAQARLGAGAYRGLYSLVALAGFALIIVGWPKADASVLYATPYAVRYGVYGLMAIAFVMLAAYALPNGRIAIAVKHPMLAAVKIWAFAHLLVYGEARSVRLFGAFLAYAVAARISAKGREAPAAAASGNALYDGMAVLIGLALWAAVFAVAHPYLAGVALH